MELTTGEIATCKTDLLSFSETMFKSKGHEFKRNWHHTLICSTLEKVLLGQIRRLIINIPPRYSKTELAVINFMAWSLGIVPESEFIHTSYSKRLAASNSWKVKSLCEDPVYKQIFPEMSIKDDTKARDEWRTDQGGIVYATGSGGTITGYGAGKMRDMFGGAIIIDDPHKASEANSEIIRQNVIDWFHETIESRCNSPTTPIILIMQRLHEEDLSGHLLDGGNGEVWNHLMIPALDDITGDALWEWKHTLGDLKRMERTNPYVYAGQYMQSPAPLGGGIFKNEWWKFYKVPPNYDWKIIVADTAQKEEEYNDFTVLQCWAYHEGNIYLLDQLRDRFESPELKTNVKAFWNKWVGSGIEVKGKLRCMYVEDKASGTGLIQDLRKETKIPVMPIERFKDKVTRAMDAAPYVSSGYVFLPEDAVWLSDYLAEMGRFTPLMTHKHDDQVDATIDAIEIMLRGPQSEAGTW